MLEKRKTGEIVLFIIGCILVNYIGKLFANHFTLPLWLDSVGTVFTAYVLGPVCGAVVGITVNVIYGILFSYTHMVYALVSAMVAVLVGVLSRKGGLENLFRALSTSFFVTILSVVGSVPLNYLFFDGSTGNVWGDGVTELFRRLGLNSVFSHIIGEFYIDFSDKTLTILILFLTVRAYRRHRQFFHDIFNRTRFHKSKRTSGTLLLVLLVCGSLFVNPIAGMAEEKRSAAASVDDAQETDNYNAYVQTIYNGSNGLPGGSVNDIAQTNDGVLWIGTYGGLYRYGGNEFEWMDEFESVKNVNCMYTDEEGRLWIGTNDSGLSICIDEKISNVVTEEDGLSSDSVRCITQCTDGDYYVGTTGALAVLTLSGGLSVETVIPDIVYAGSISADSNGNVAVVTSEGTLYLLKNRQIVSEAKAKEGEVYTCCSFAEDGTLYAGTTGSTIAAFDICATGLKQKTTRSCEGLRNLKSLHFSEEGVLFACGDTGMGYVDTQKEYHPISSDTFNSSVDHMLIDYQGNLWFTSSRLGLLRLCPSVFMDVYHEAGLEDKVVNCVTQWKGNFYFGTDNGLDMADASLERRLTSSLTKQLQGVRIRNLYVDQKNRLWISTSGNGLYEVEESGKMTVYTDTNGLPGNKLRMVVELEDGTIVSAGDSGIAYIENGKITDVIGYADGLNNPKVLCLLEREDGTLLAGTDGGGVSVIQNRQVIRTLTRQDGIGSEVILRMIEDSDGTGIFFVTSNSICYQDENGIRILDFPYYNNYDIVEGTNGMLFVLGSAGIYVADKEDVLAGKADYKLLDSQVGLLKSFTPNAWNYMDDEENLYLSTDSGVLCMNLNRYTVSVRSYRMIVRSIKVDDSVYSVERGETTVLPSGVSRIEIVPEIINYSLNLPYVSVYMEGFDKQPKVIPQNELKSVTYTNLPVGTYTFHLGVMDKRGKKIVAESTYTIEKEREIYDNWWFMAYAVFVFAAAVAYLTWLFFRTQIQRTLNMQKRELEFARSQVEMGNETVLTIARTVDAKDENTSQHSVRVSEYSVMIARRLGFDDTTCEQLRKAALLHDIGKIGIPDRVLNKPGRLTDEEYEIMKSHVVKGAEILKKFTLVENVQEGALYHHERYDGKGYVHGLKGEEIPLNARIIGIADAFDAMTANRVYRKKLDFEFVIGELKKGRGTQFDPQLVDIMLQLIEEKQIDVERLYAETVTTADEEVQE